LLTHRGFAPDEAAGEVASDYRGDHHHLLQREFGPAGDSATAGPDGIVIPVNRSVAADLPGLRLGVSLAADFDCDLLVLCSGAAKAADIKVRFGHRRVEAQDVDPGRLGWRKSFQAHRHPISTLHRCSDMGAKRSEGILEGARRGWNYVLFLDDDVWPTTDGDPTLDAAALRRARASMTQDSRLRAVGWTSDDYPDNSVYGHARRLIGLPQTVFIGSSALFVPLDPQTPFFPDVYNEDWLFLIESALRSCDPHNAFGRAGGMNQLPYWPYRIDRARSEEAGDVLGEGLMNSLEDEADKLGTRAASTDYWREALVTRKRRLAEAVRDVQRATAGAAGSERERQGARTALLAAEGVRHLVPAYSLADYYDAWQHDLECWREELITALQRGGGGRPAQRLPVERSIPQPGMAAMSS
jgi:hypothetical protein